MNIELLDRLLDAARHQAGDSGRLSDADDILQLQADLRGKLRENAEDYFYFVKDLAAADKFDEEADGNDSAVDSANELNAWIDEARKLTSHYAAEF